MGFIVIAATTTAPAAIAVVRHPGQNRSMEGVRIRDAELGELDTVLELIMDGYSEFGPFVTAEFAEEFREDAASVLNDLHTEVLVGEVDGKLGGTITLYPDGKHYSEKVPSDWSCLRTLAVLPAHRGRGVGRALMAEAIGRARKLGRSRVLLHTLPFMESAIRLHEMLGFRRAPDLDAEYSEVTAIAYLLDLQD